MGPVHDKFISWKQICMLVIREHDKMLRDLRNSKGNRQLSAV